MNTAPDHILEHFSRLSPDSEPGTYEVKTVKPDGSFLTYELTLPDDYLEPIVIIISRFENQPEPLEGRETITCFHFSAQVKEPAVFYVSAPDTEGLQSPKTGPVVSIVRVE